MASSSLFRFPSPSTMLLALVLLIIGTSFQVSGSSQNADNLVDIIWGGERGVIAGEALSLAISNGAGSGFRSKKEYLFARFDADLKLPKDAAGIVTTFYLSSPGEGRDEVDLEFLGNVSGSPYTLHTNIYAQGKGHRERGFHFWFDPTEDFHRYTVIWTQKHIIFMVDDKAIRVHKNMEHLSLPFPTKQPMKLYGTIWNAEQWATQGGKVKADWSKGPYIARYRKIAITENYDRDVTEEDKKNIRKVEKESMIYNHCDFNLHPEECKQQL